MKEWKLRIERRGEERDGETEDLDTNAGLGEINEWGINQEKDLEEGRGWHMENKSQNK